MQKKRGLVLGAKVRWESQSGGNTKMKVGEIVGVVPASSRGPLLSYVANVSLVDVRYKFNTSPIDGSGANREHESYLVAVYPPAPSKARPKLYWPRVSQLSCE